MGKSKTEIALNPKQMLEVSIDEQNRTVVARILTGDDNPEFIYAEKFDLPCNYLREAIKKGIVYISGEIADKNGFSDKNKTDSLNGEKYMV